MSSRLVNLGRDNFNIRALGSLVYEYKSIMILFLHLLLGTLSEVEAGDELEVGVGTVLQYMWKVKYQ